MKLLRWCSLAVFLCVIVFGGWRYRIHSEANASHAQMKVRVLAEVKASSREPVQLKLAGFSANSVTLGAMPRG